MHHILTQDFQPGGNTLLIFVTGQFVVDEDVDKPFFFSQVFQLVSSGSSYYVQHDIFRRVSLT